MLSAGSGKAEFKNILEHAFAAGRPVFLQDVPFGSMRSTLIRIGIKSAKNWKQMRLNTSKILDRLQTAKQRAGKLINVLVNWALILRQPTQVFVINMKVFRSLDEHWNIAAGAANI